MTSEPEVSRLRVAILGVGNELNGDDVAGVLVVRALQRYLARHAEPAPALPYARWQSCSLFLVEAGVAPESFGGPLRRFQPDWVILIDAAEMGLAAGSVQEVDWADAAGWSGSTHTLPPTVLAEYLSKTIGCRLSIIGIQPARLDFDSGVSRPVLIAIRKVCQQVLERLKHPEAQPGSTKM